MQDENSGTPSPCPICLRASDLAHVVLANEHWIVRHSGETDIVGYVLIEARRHVLDLSEASAEECRSYGLILQSVMHAVRQVTACERVYTFSLGEAVPHYHLHVIPRRKDFRAEYVGRGIMAYPLQPVASTEQVADICVRLRQELAGFCREAN